MKQDKNIILVHKVFPIDFESALGGAETVMIEMAQALKNRGWNVYFFGHFLSFDNSIEGINFVNFGKDFQLVEVFRDYKNIEFEACISVHAFPIKVLLSFDNIKRFFLFPQDMSFIEHRVSTEFINKYVDGVICLSEYQKSAYAEWGIVQDKLIKIPYGIDTEFYKPLSNVKRNPKKIMFAGATIKSKGIYVLIDAFKKLKDDMEDIELHVYGDSSLWGLEESIDNKTDIPGLFFHGKVGKSELIKAYSESALCIIPTIPELYKESLPRSAIEAQACGCPVIGSESGGLPETFLHTKTGFLVKPINEDNLYKVIKNALSDEERLKKMSENAIQFIRENYSIDKQIKQLEEYILSIKPSKSKVDSITYNNLRILFYVEVPLMPSKTSSCRRNYEILKILLDLGANITYSHGFFIKDAEKEVAELSRAYKNFNMKSPLYENFSTIGLHDALWITEVWDYKRLRKAVSLARRAKLLYNIPVVYDAMDSIYKHYDRARLVGESLKEIEFESIKVLEQEMYKLADIVIVVSEEEKNYIIENFDVVPEKITIIRNIHHPSEDFQSHRSKAICFIGGLMNFNNLLAIKYFLNNIYHHVLRKNPYVEFHTIGDRTELLKLEDLVEDKSLLELYRNKVHFIGWVEDVGKELKRYALTVAPMISGSGIKGKILNSLEHGIPVVTTPMGAEGLPEIEKSGVVIAWSPEEFAEKVVEIVENDELRLSLSQKGLSYIKEWFSIDKARETLENLLPMIKRAMKANFALARPYRHKLIDDYNLILPENYLRVDDLMELIGMSLDYYRDDYPDIVRFSYLDVHNTEPWLKPDAISEELVFSICTCMPVLVRKGIETAMFNENRLTYVHLDLPVCYKEYSARGAKNRIIEFGLKHKMLFKKHPLVERIAKKLYEYLKK